VLAADDAGIRGDHLKQVASAVSRHQLFEESAEAAHLIAPLRDGKLLDAHRRSRADERGVEHAVQVASWPVLAALTLAGVGIGRLVQHRLHLAVDGDHSDGQPLGSERLAPLFGAHLPLKLGQ